MIIYEIIDTYTNKTIAYFKTRFEAEKYCKQTDKIFKEVLIYYDNLDKFYDKQLIKQFKEDKKDDSNKQ